MTKDRMDARPGMPAERSAEVVVRVLPSSFGPDDADLGLTALVAGFLSVPPDQVRVRRLCPHCAGTDHGRPVVLPVEGARVHVSIARTWGLTAVAVAAQGPVGVDVEMLESGRFEGVDAVALRPDEGEPATLRELGTQWVRKEAVLKATGRGLPWGPERVEVSPDQGPPVAVHVDIDGRPVRVWVSDVDVGTGYAAAVAVVSPTPPRVQMAD
jgi:4'-phosphopantetheinyl transferase